MEFDKKTVIYVGGAFIISAAIYYLYCKTLKKAKPDNNQNQPKLDCKFRELEILISEGTNEGWNEIKKTDTFNVYKKDTGDSPIAIIKAFIIIKDTSIEDVHFAIWDGDFRRSWDSVAQDFQVIDKTDHQNDVIYFYAKSPVPWLVSNREFVQHRMYRRDGDKIMIVYWSADRPDRAVPENWVRANTIISGYIIEKGENPGEVKVNFITQNDVKGSIPPQLINTYAPIKALNW
eukprot:CAMPEP_0202948930 /NCGR_PEP_ID=MMETSP1395-20130829/14783_1 /ASSEMBLY_ACC=CAM_ASM_000871 /TAXON_ID=5961 /ORGANISM="Blepharisma japonicum, Strain Stock R1072" /LENGTH=232 /DNA_ID=CAMNT_0049651493 /DNA_START=6 /DNA_END=701 /DNA_ORIENTATION=-